MNLIYRKYFSTGYISDDITDKLALMSLTGALMKKLQDKNVDTSFYKVLKQLSGKQIKDTEIKGLASVCEDFAYGCTKFETFGIPDKEIPNQIKSLLDKRVPF